MRFLLCPVLRALPVRWVSGLPVRMMCLAANLRSTTPLDEGRENCFTVRCRSQGWGNTNALEKWWEKDWRIVQIQTTQGHTGGKDKEGWKKYAKYEMWEKQLMRTTILYIIHRFWGESLKTCHWYHMFYIFYTAYLFYLICAVFCMNKA